MAAFDARCQSCPHRHDARDLPQRVVEQLQLSWSRPATLQFDEDGASGLLGQSLDGPTSRQFAEAMAHALTRGFQQPATVVLAGDGRPATAELVAAASEAFRWSGCQVIETRSSTTAGLLFAQASYQAEGALLIGNADGTPRTASLRGYGPGGSPLAGDEIARHRSRGSARASRRCGAWRRGSAEAEYLSTLESRFHALRPLRFRWETSCAPIERYLNRLLAPVACRPISPREYAEQAGGACHFGIWIDGDGERCRVSDETGQELRPEAILTLLAEFLSQAPGEAVIVEDTTPESTVQRLTARGFRVLSSPASRVAMHRALGRHNARLGGGSSGRFWFAAPAPLPDALHVVALLLAILSQSDRPLSQVAAGAAG
jgi:phosphomannomutase